MLQNIPNCLTCFSLNGVKKGGWTVTTVPGFLHDKHSPAPIGQLLIKVIGLVLLFEWSVMTKLMNIRDQIAQIIHSKNFKHGTLYTIFSFVNNGISFIMLLILAKFLTPHDYGQLNLFTTFVTLLNIVISLCTTSYFSVNFFKRKLNFLRQLIIISLGVTTMMLIVISMIMTIVPEFVERCIGVSIHFLWLGVFICYFQVYNSLNLEIWRLEEKPVYYGIYSVSMAIGYAILTFWFIVGLKLGWEGRVYANWLIGIIYFLISILFLIKRKYLVLILPKLNLIKETLWYSIPLIPHSISFWLKLGLDRYIINYFHDQTAVGYFSFAMNLAAVINIFGNAFNSTNSVFIYKKLTEGYEETKRILSKQTNLMTLLFFVISIVVAVFAWGLIHWFLPHYKESVSYILPLCVGGYFSCIYILWVNYLFFYKKTKQLMFITLSTAVIQVVLSLIFTRFSPLYTAYISMATNGLTAFLVYRLSKNTLKDVKE